MISEDRKYQSDIFKITGFALMTPLGRFVLNLLELGPRGDIVSFVLNVIGSFILFFFGIIAIQRGYEFVQED